MTNNIRFSDTVTSGTNGIPISIPDSQGDWFLLGALKNDLQINHEFVVLKGKVVDINERLFAIRYYGAPIDILSHPDLLTQPISDWVNPLGSHMKFAKSVNANQVDMGILSSSAYLLGGSVGNGIAEDRSVGFYENVDWSSNGYVLLFLISPLSGPLDTHLFVSWLEN